MITRRFQFLSKNINHVLLPINQLTSLFSSFLPPSIIIVNCRFVSASTASDHFVGGGAPNLEGSNNIKSPLTDEQVKNSAKATKKPCPIADFVTTDPFACLGLERTASKEQVRENFLQLAKVHHPDVGGESWKFKRVNAAYKQSIQMIETGYAAKTAAEMKQKKEKEEEESNAYRAPHERTRSNYYSSATSEKENAKTSNNNTTKVNDQDGEESRHHFYSWQTSSDKERPENVYANAKRTANFSSASNYASAERQQRNNEGSSFSSQHGGRTDSTSKYYHEFMSSQQNQKSEKEGKEFIRNSQMRDDKAKSHNKSQDWFKEMYETSWSGKNNNKNNNNNNNSNSQDEETTTAKKNETNKNSEKKKAEGENNENNNNNGSAERTSSSSANSEKHSADREFGSDEGWFEFRENFFSGKMHSFTPRDLYRFRFSQATTVKEIDEIYDEAMTQNIFSGFDIGEPLHLALERYHLELGLGPRHLEKCFEKIDDWEARTKAKATCIYYQCILKIYTNERMLMLFPDVDASMAAEVVWKTLEKMQQNEVNDDTGIAWWNVLSTALMYRDPHGYSGQS